MFKLRLTRHYEVPAHFCPVISPWNGHSTIDKYLIEGWQRLDLSWRVFPLMEVQRGFKSIRNGVYIIKNDEISNWQILSTVIEIAFLFWRLVLMRKRQQTSVFLLKGIGQLIKPLRRTYNLEQSGNSRKCKAQGQK